MNNKTKTKFEKILTSIYFGIKMIAIIYLLSTLLGLFGAFVFWDIKIFTYAAFKLFTDIHTMRILMFAFILFAIVHYKVDLE